MRAVFGFEYEGDFFLYTSVSICSCLWISFLQYQNIIFLAFPVGEAAFKCFFAVDDVLKISWSYFLFVSHEILY